MTGNIREVEFRSPEPKKEVVELLEELLDKARRGEVERVIFAVMTPAKTIETAWHLGGDFVLTAGMASTLHHEIMSSAIIDRIDELDGALRG